MSIPINHAHLIHDSSSGRSSTRLHAPPGGKSSMGTSFGWAEEAPAPQQQQRHNQMGSQVFGNDSHSNAAPDAERTFVRKNKKEFVDSRIGAHSAPTNENSNRNAQQQSNAGGFGDTGKSSVKINNAPGGKSSGNILSWD
jgi:hypothetical protein